MLYFSDSFQSSPIAVQSFSREELIQMMEYLFSIVRTVRSVCQQYSIPLTKSLPIQIVTDDSWEQQMIQNGLYTLYCFIRMESVEVLGATEFLETSEQAVVNVVRNSKIIISLGGVVENEKEIQRLQKRIETLEKERSCLQEILEKSGFLERAPKAVVERNKFRLFEISKQLIVLSEQLMNLSRE